MGTEGGKHLGKPKTYLTYKTIIIMSHLYDKIWTRYKKVTNNIIYILREYLGIKYFKSLTLWGRRRQTDFRLLKIQYGENFLKQPIK